MVRTQVRFPAPANQLFITPVLGEPMASLASADTEHMSCNAWTYTQAKHPGKKLVNDVKSLSFNIAKLGKCLPNQQEAWDLSLAPCYLGVAVRAYSPST